MLPAGMARGSLGIPSFESRPGWTTKRYAERKTALRLKSQPQTKRVSICLADLMWLDELHFGD
jgi:hypothetical protein